VLGSEFPDVWGTRLYMSEVCWRSWGPIEGEGEKGKTSSAREWLRKYVYGLLPISLERTLKNFCEPFSVNRNGRKFHF
jgi:hypothetical protein